MNGNSLEVGHVVNLSVQSVTTVILAINLVIVVEVIRDVLRVAGNDVIREREITLVAVPRPAYAGRDDAIHGMSLGTAHIAPHVRGQKGVLVATFANLVRVRVTTRVTESAFLAIDALRSLRHQVPCHCV